MLDAVLRVAITSQQTMVRTGMAFLETPRDTPTIPNRLEDCGIDSGCEKCREHLEAPVDDYRVSTWLPIECVRFTSPPFYLVPYSLHGIGCVRPLDIGQRRLLEQSFLLLRCV